MIASEHSVSLLQPACPIRSGQGSSPYDVPGQATDIHMITIRLLLYFFCHDPFSYGSHFPSLVSCIPYQQQVKQPPPYVIIWVFASIQHFTPFWRPVRPLCTYSTSPSSSPKFFVGPGSKISRPSSKRPISQCSPSRPLVPGYASSVRHVKLLSSLTMTTVPGRHWRSSIQPK